MAENEPKSRPALVSLDVTSSADDVPSEVAADKAESLSVALHEIGNSLTAVLGWLEIASRSTHGEARGAIVSAMSRARSAHRTARRAIGAEVSPEPPRLLAELVDEVVRALDPEAQRRGAFIHCQLFPDLRSVMVTEGEALSRVLTNLILNAVEHSGVGDHVRIVGDTAYAGHALLSVSDDGPGVPQELREGLFEAKTSGRRGGAGIGLAHASELARHASGSIRLVPSQRGAHFVVTWPFQEGSFQTTPTLVPERNPSSYRGGAAPSNRPTQTNPPVSGTLTSMRLLLVEDDLAISEMLRSALTARGATVRVVSRRRDIEQALEESTYQGVLLDLSPIADDVSGVLTLVHQKNPSARLIMISGSVEGLPKLSPDISITWVQKPFELEDVVRALTDPRDPRGSSVRETG